MENRSTTPPTAGSAPHWYALKVYYNRVQPLLQTAAEEGIEYFAPTDIISGLLFLRCSEEEVMRFGSRHWQHAWVYRMAESRRPAAISCWATTGRNTMWATAWWSPAAPSREPRDTSTASNATGGWW